MNYKINIANVKEQLERENTASRSVVPHFDERLKYGDECSEKAGRMFQNDYL